MDLDNALVKELEELGIEVRQVPRTAEFWVTCDGDRYNVYQGSDEGDDPDGWYIDLTPEGSTHSSDETGPYDSAEDAIQDIFIDENV